MELLITGASGFVGKYVVAAGLRRGHRIKAIVRPETDVTGIPWHDHERLELARIDLLRQPTELTAALTGVEAVIHLAAVKSGNFDEQFAGTVTTTQHLLAAMAAATVARLVAVSTFSVYEYEQKRAHSLLDEDSPLVTAERVVNRDEYSQTKLIQEQLYRKFEQEGGKVTILRPGMIYGREYLWHALLGAEFGSVFLRIGTRGTLPLSYVENCAEAMIIAAESEAAIGQTLNIVDDNLPTQGQYTQALKQRHPSPKLYYCPWVVIKAIAGFGWWMNQTFLKGGVKMPGIAVPAKLHSRFKPLRYTNQRAKTVLNWQPKYSFTASLDRSCGDLELLKV